MIFRLKWQQWLLVSPDEASRLSDWATAKASRRVIMDETICGNLIELVKMLLPVVHVLMMCDSQAPMLGEVYPVMTKLHRCLALQFGHAEEQCTSSKKSFWTRKFAGCRTSNY